MDTYPSTIARGVFILLPGCGVVSSTVNIAAASSLPYFSATPGGDTFIVKAEEVDWP